MSGNQLSERLRYGASVHGEAHLNNGVLVEYRHDPHIDRDSNACLSDGIHPPLESLHIVAELCRYEISPCILLHAEMSDVFGECLSLDVLLRRTRHTDDEFVSVFFPEKCDQLTGMCKVSACPFPALRDISSEGKNIVDPEFETSVHLSADIIFITSDTCKMRKRHRFPGIRDRLAYFHMPPCI